MKISPPQFALWAILAVGAVLRCGEAFGRPLQVDEALMVAEARLPLREGIANIALDVHPPLILFLLRPFEIIHSPDFAPRLLMIAFGLASVVLVYGIVRLWTDERTALLAAACAAVMPTIAHYDTWIRMYAPLSTAELFGWYALSLLVKRDNLSAVVRRAWWTAWVLTWTAAVYLHYLGWIALAAQVIWIIARHRAAAFKAIAGAAAVVVLWLPQLRTFLDQTSRGGRSWAYALGHPGLAILQIPGDALLHPETPFGLDALHVGALVWTACALAAVIAFARRTALPWLGLSGALTVAASLGAHLSLYGDRYYLPLAYAICAWTVIGLNELWIRGFVMRAAICGAFAGLAAYAALLAFDPYFYTADWPAVSAYIRQHAAPGAPLIAEQSSSFLALTHYDDLAGHQLVGVDAGGATAVRAVRYAQRFKQVWLVVFESTAVDPDEDLIKMMTTDLHPVTLMRFTRRSAAETVLLVEFQRP